MAPSLEAQHKVSQWRKELGRVATPRSNPGLNAQQERLSIVAIDFGTTFSAIAYATSLDPEVYEREDLTIHYSCIKAQSRYFDAGIFKKRDEVPSVLAYDRETGQPYFGIEVETALRDKKLKDTDKLELLKLLIARKSLISKKSLEELTRRISTVRRTDPHTGHGLPKRHQQ